MTCGDKFNKNCPTGGTRVAPAEADGRSLCIFPGCGKRLQGDGTCVDGHRQEFPAPVLAQRQALEDVLDVYHELDWLGLVPRYGRAWNLALEVRANQDATPENLATANRRLRATMDSVYTLVLGQRGTLGDHVRFTKDGISGDGTVIAVAGDKQEPIYILAGHGVAAHSDQQWHPAAQRTPEYTLYYTVRCTEADVQEVFPLAADPRLQAARARQESVWPGPGPYTATIECECPGNSGTAIVDCPYEGTDRWEYGEHEEDFDVDWLRVEGEGHEATLWLGDRHGVHASFTTERATLLELAQAHVQGETSFDLEGEGDAILSGAEFEQEWEFDRVGISPIGESRWLDLAFGANRDFRCSVPRETFHQLCQDVLAALRPPTAQEKLQ